MESVSFHLKYWLKLTYPIVVSIYMLARCTLSALPNGVMSKIECRQLHSELFGCRHSTLQSHGLWVSLALVMQLLLWITHSKCKIRSLITQDIQCFCIT